MSGLFKASAAVATWRVNAIRRLTEITIRAASNITMV
jgi:hypothetical protein